MDTHLILSVLSNDRPGIIKLIAATVAKHQGNWLESRLTQLAGKFAGVIRICVDAQQVADLQASLQELKHQGIRVISEELHNTNPFASTHTASFSAIGPDRQGIVLEITQAFTQYNINVAHLNTNCSSVPYSGEPLFEAHGELHIPMDANLDHLSDQLDTIADALGIDISLDNGQPATL